jgi:2-keto-4-pentenoate hydratase/2-oxohepta-3-ene-1,7-dioic acid hydratase in catechol pathway
VKLAMFTLGGARGIGLVEGDELCDLTAADPSLPVDLIEVLTGGDDSLDAVRALAGRARRHPLASVRLEAPISAPRKFLGLGLSFRSHVEELRAKKIPIAIPPHQVWFNKQVTAVNGPYDPIHLPRSSSQLDYEGELAMVIGRRARHVDRTNAAAVIAGYVVCNDVSVRDWQLRSPTATLGKSFDTHGPIGPWLTTADEVEDPHHLRIRTWVDGELRQDGNTSDFIYSLGEMIEELSSVFTLEPGDILTTGCPAGVGALMDPPRFLTVGQSVRIEVEGLGHIENRVIDEPALPTQSGLAGGGVAKRA